MNGSRNRSGRVWVVHRWVIVTRSEVSYIHVEVFWVMTPCNLVGGWNIVLCRSTCFFLCSSTSRVRVCGSHWPAWASSFSSALWLATFVLCDTHLSPFFKITQIFWNRLTSALKMKAVCSCEMLVPPPHQLTTQCHNLANHVLCCLCTSSGWFVGGKTNREQ
jgi:hypothetical protein